MKKILIGIVAVLVAGCQSTTDLGKYRETDVEKRISYLANKLKKSIVNIQMVKEYYLYGKKQKYSSLCSGSIISEDGLIVTNYHCVGDAKKIWVTLWNKKKVDADLIGEDPLTDLGFIKLKKSKKWENVKLQPLKFGRYEDVKDGQYVFALGSPFGFSQTITLGIVANKKRVLSLEFESKIDVGQAENPIVHWIHHTAPIYGGNSGGPLVNMNGEQIGVNARGVVGGLSLAIAIDVVKEVLDRILKFGKPNWSYYGWRLTELTDELKELNKLPENITGVFVSDVIEGSPAYVAGIRSEDILLEVDNVKLDASIQEDLPPILKLLAAKPVGTPVSAKLRRKNGEIYTTTVVPEEWELWEIPLMAEEPGFQREKDFYASEVYGFSVQKIVKKMAVKERLTYPWGVFVQGIETGSTAANAGLKAGDIIKYIDDKPITDMDTFKKNIEELEKKRPEKIKLTVQSGNSIRYLFLRDIEKLVEKK